MLRRVLRAFRSSVERKAIKMGRSGFLGSFQGIDAFGKVCDTKRCLAGADDTDQTMEDVKIRTRTGALCQWIERIQAHADAVK